MKVLANSGSMYHVGLHTGEIEVRGDDIGGLAVNIGAHVVALADSGEVLVRELSSILSQAQE